MALQLLDSADRVTIVDTELPNVKNGDPDVTYLLKPIAVDDHRAIVKAHTKDVIDRRTHQRYPETDWGAVNDAVLDFVLQDWTGMLLRGSAAPCTRENKLRLDPDRRKALTDLAGMNQIARADEVRADSFRESADVPAVLGR